MSMKTPEQIANDALTRYPLNRDIGRADARGIVRDAIEADRAQRLPLTVEPDSRSMSLQTSRIVQPKEIIDLVFGTGALSWEWWRDAQIITRCEDASGSSVDMRSLEDCDHIVDWFDPETTMVQLRHWSADDPSKTVTSQVSFPQLVRVAAEALEHWGSEDVQDMKTDSLGYADSLFGDNILQRAVFGATVYG